MRQLTIVIKLGTSSIVDEKSHVPLIKNLSNIAETAVQLRALGHRVVIVSSGAIGVALRRMNLDCRPNHLPKVQALAALGQCRLMRLWVDLFDNLDQAVAQVLLTRHDIADRTQYTNAQNTFAELLDMGVIPIVNENDTISVSEIKFGDNDTLSAITAGMINADYLFLMTDVDCLYDKNPRKFPDASPIEVVADISQLVADVSSAGSSVGTGGMATKITAARLATTRGVTTVITRSAAADRIPDIVKNAEQFAASRRGSCESLVGAVEAVPAGNVPLHTRFLPMIHPVRDRAFWILSGLKPMPGSIVYITPQAYRTLQRKNHGGLSPTGVVHVAGSFGQQEAVFLQVLDPTEAVDLDGANLHTIFTSAVEVGRAVVSYSAAELRQIKGAKSGDISRILGYADTEYVALKDNVALYTEAQGSSSE